jgi:hypothetical protein
MNAVPGTPVAVPVAVYTGLAVAMFKPERSAAA